jgi:hypothetical protein
VRECRCAASVVARYQQRLSGPLLDRIDIHLDVPRVEYDQLSDRRSGELSVTTGRVTGTPFPWTILGAGQPGGGAASDRTRILGGIYTWRRRG